jgi:hypothetical protein
LPINDKYSHQTLIDVWRRDTPNVSEDFSMFDVLKHQGLMNFSLKSLLCI